MQSVGGGGSACGVGCEAALAVDVMKVAVCGSGGWPLVGCDGGEWQKVVMMVMVFIAIVLLMAEVAVVVRVARGLVKVQCIIMTVVQIVAMENSGSDDIGAHR